MTSTEKFLALTLDLISEFGWSVVGVDGTEPFAYTVGLTVRDWPELEMYGVAPKQAQGLINTLIQMYEPAGLGPQPGPCPKNYLQDDMPAWLIPMDPAGLLGRMSTALRIYDDPELDTTVRGLQIVLCDQKRRLPWDKGHRARDVGRQRVLGIPPGDEQRKEK